MGDTGEDYKAMRDLIDVHETAELLGVGVSTVWALAKRGTIPCPVRLGDKKTRWIRKEVIDYINNLPRVKFKE